MMAAVIVCCLLAGSQGCWRARHGVVLRGDWSLEFNRIPWIKNRSIDYQCPAGPALGCSTAGADCGPDCGPQLDRPAIAPAGDPAALSAAGPACDQGECAVVDCGACGGRLLGGRCRTCGLPSPPEEAVAVGYQHHPRFHPVPVKPVFSPPTEPMQQAVFDVPVGSSPRAYQAVDSPSGKDGPRRIAPPANPPASIRIDPPDAAPEEVQTPQPSAEPDSDLEDRVTRAPARLPLAAGSSSMIFKWPKAGQPTSDRQARLPSATGAASR
jgi:hypothetical protein